MKSSERAAFVKTVYGYYKKHGRHDLAWRSTKDPYKITVSEVMLQQTQVDRVKDKYKLFLKEFPTVQSLAKASLQKVLLIWSGLGYNRRAKFLQKMAQIILSDYKGTFPKTVEELVALPGIGTYTAGAIMAFAHNTSGIFIETNIRTVYLHHFPSLRSGPTIPSSAISISDKDLLSLIEATLDYKNPRDWYWALMDYGAYLKSQGVVIHRASKQYKKQSPFKGSLREVRGGIIKTLTEHPATIAQLQKKLSFEKEKIVSASQGLLKEGLIVKKSTYFHVA